MTFDISNYKFGNSCLYQTKNNFITITEPDITKIQNGDFTIEFWAYDEETHENRTYIYIGFTDLSGGNSYTEHGAISLHCHAYNNQICFSIAREYETTTWAIDRYNYGPQFTVNTWTHYAIVRYGNYMMLYQNGNRIAYEYLPKDNMIYLRSNVIAFCKFNNNDTYNNLRIDELLITNYARYTESTVSIPSAQFEVIDGIYYENDNNIYGLI